MASNVQTIRFRRPENKGKPPPSTKPKNRHEGILQDQLRRAQRAPWVPSWQTAFRLILLVRVAGAMYSNLQDCDEVFNYWEPLHYLNRGYGFQTWETSPLYAIRSWAYILLHLPPVKAALTFIGADAKRPAFFAVRITLAFIATFCEVTLIRAVAEKINYRVGRYLFFMLLFSAGLWSSSTAFLPSTFAMYANTLAFAWSLEPTSSTNFRRTLLSTLAYAAGAVVGWPFALLVAVPFVIEELFLPGSDIVSAAQHVSWSLGRFKRLITCGAVSALLLVPVVALDTLFYGKITIVPWNIVKYNVFPDQSRGPELYGTEPSTYYIYNLLLNFNVLLPLALVSLPALSITHRIDRLRLGNKHTSGQSSPFTIIALRLAPVYLWLAILSKQPHKEERFIYPVYTLLCFNAAVALYLIRGWFEVAYIKFTQSAYKASRSGLFSRFTLSIISASIVFSVSRIMAQWKYYHAPMTIAFRFESQELPRLLNATGYITLPPLTNDTASRSQRDDEERLRIDYSPLKNFGLRLCYGKEWHRFPGHFLIPDGIRVDWIKSEFDGMLPGHFLETPYEGGLTERVKGTRSIPPGLNDLNNEAPEFYVSVSECDYLIDLDFPFQSRKSIYEPRYAVDIETWDRVTCKPFLDASHSPLLTRALWMPGERWQQLNKYGDYCLLRHRENVARKEKENRVRVEA